MTFLRAVALGFVVSSVAGCGSDVATSESGGDTAGMWLRRFGRSSYLERNSLSAFPGGGVAIAGRYYGEIDFGGDTLPSPSNNYQAYVAKYDSGGKHIYSKSFGAEFAEYASAVVALADGSVVFAGAYNWPIDFGTGELPVQGSTDIYVAKLDPSGKVSWVKSFGGPNEEHANALAATPDGGVVLAGFSAGKFPIELTTDDSQCMFLLQLDSKGDAVWAEPTVLSYIDTYSIAVGGNGNIIIGGGFSNTLSIPGLADVTSNNFQDAFVAAFDKSGTALWSHIITGTGYFESVHGVAVSADGSRVYATGQVQGTVDFGGGTLSPAANEFESRAFLLELSESGEHKAHLRAGGFGESIGHAITVDGQGNIAMTGRFHEELQFGTDTLRSKGSYDAWFVTFDSNLALKTETSWGDTDDQVGYGVDFDGNNRVYIGGALLGTVDFGLGPTSGSGYYESFLLSIPSK